MKKVLLCVALCATILLVGCNNDKEKVNSGDVNDNQLNVQQGGNTDPEDEPTTVTYDTPDFTQKAGFKVNLDSSLGDVKYDAIFLSNNRSAQLDLVFNDGTIGTLVIEPYGGASHSFDVDETVKVGETDVNYTAGADGIYTYSWEKGEQAFYYSTKADIKGSERLTNLVNGVSVELDENFNR